MELGLSLRELLVLLCLFECTYKSIHKKPTRFLKELCQLVQKGRDGIQNEKKS